jgi:hypothetical protein
VLLDRFGAGVHPGGGAVVVRVLGVEGGDVGGGEGVVLVGAGAVGVEPGVQLDAAEVGLVDGEGEGIPARIVALGAAEGAAPRVEL